MPTSNDSYLAILIVSDEEIIQEHIKTALVNTGFYVGVVRHEAALRDTLAHGHRRFDVVIIDMDLPKIDGVSICRSLRAHQQEIRIILLTTAEDAVYGIVGLEMGADYYMLKPFSAIELVARVRAIQRRFQQTALKGPKMSFKDLRFGNFQLDISSYELLVQDVVISLTRRETELLAYLIQRANRLVSRDELFMVVWGDESRDMRVVDKLISLVRMKLYSVPNTGISLRTVRGAGYLLRVDVTR